MREWTCTWQGIPIVVRNWTRWVRTGEELYVGGVKVDSNESNLFTRMSAHLAAPISIAGVRHNVEAVLGQAGIRVACRILVDGEVIGGDQRRQSTIPDATAWEKIREAGLPRYLLTKGLMQFGIPFATIMVAIGPPVRDRSWGAIGVQWALSALLFGLPMALLTWRSTEVAYRSRRTKLAENPRFTA